MRKSLKIFMVLLLCTIFHTEASTVAVHDPSIIVVYKDASGNSYPSNNASGSLSKYYYLFGTQLAAAYSTDMINWTSFTPTFSVNGTVSTDNVQIFKTAAAWSQHTTSADVFGNLWAPDLIYNKALQKWCMYYAVNGDSWLSSIVMLTSSKIEGPYQYAGSVVYSGMTNATSGFGNTDYTTVTGTATVNSRYLDASGNWTGTYGSSCIDPHVLYDQSGKLWMSYGSWSGGVFLIKLDEATGLRDNSYNYGFGTSAIWSSNALRYDPYMGIHIAGGYYVSGEGNFIQYLKDANGNGYYYLFVSYGFYSPTGGYDMRVFRSATINGSYKDVTGDSATYAKYILNYGSNVQYGFPLMQNYKWSWWTNAEVSMGGNSVLLDDDSSAYVIYHRKYDDGTASHEVKVHQLFFNDQGWILAAPFEYRQKYGLRKTAYSVEDIAGKYGIIVHNAVDYASMASNAEQQLYLNADGSISGAYTGTWAYSYSKGAHYLNLATTAGTFHGVVSETLKEDVSSKMIGFTAMNPANELALWGYHANRTATTRTTNYHGHTLTVGDSTFTLAWTNTSAFHKDTASEEFEAEYTFKNYSDGLNNWDNWGVSIGNGSSAWYLRADAYSNSILTGSTVGFKTDWNGTANYATAYAGKDVRVKISRIGTVINVLVFADSTLIFTATATGTPTGSYTIYLGGEACYLVGKKVSIRELGARQLVGTMNEDGTYTVAFNTAQSESTSVAGNFHLRYNFNNYHDPVSTNDWDNYIIRAISGSNTMLIRSDAYALNSFGTATFTYDWDWTNFISLLSGANVSLDIARSNDTITYNAVLTALNDSIYHYQVVNVGAPTGTMSYGFTCEKSMVDLQEIEAVRDTGVDALSMGSSSSVATSSSSTAATVPVLVPNTFTDASLQMQQGMIHLHLNESAQGTVTILDLFGHVRQTLLTGTMSPGDHTWMVGGQLGNGVYIVHVTSDHENLASKFVVVSD